MNDEKEIITTTEEEKVANNEKEPVKEKKKKKFNKKWLLLLLIPGSVLLFFAYMICFPIHSGNNIYDWITGYKPEVDPYAPVDTDGDGIADFYPLEYCRFDTDYAYSPLMDELSTWEMVSNINLDSIRYEDGGIVYFSVKGPDGNDVRFWGYNVEPSTDGLKINTEGRICSLDSFGRIYSIDCVVNDYTDGMDGVHSWGAYDISQNMHPGNMDYMAYTASGGIPVQDATPQEKPIMNYLRIQPYFFGVGYRSPQYKLHDTKDEFTNQPYTISEVNVLYRPETEMAPLRYVTLNSMNYGSYMEGDRYEEWKEGHFSPYDQDYLFDVIGVSDLNEDYLELPERQFLVWDPYDYGFDLSFIGHRAGDLRDATGKVLDKKNTVITEGMTIDVIFGEVTIAAALPIVELNETAQNLHDLIPNENAMGTGELNILCIPVSWADDHNRGNDSKYQDIQRQLGRVADMNGQVKDYSDNAKIQAFSLSSYFDTASYGKLKLTTYMTDWYQCDRPFSEMKDGLGISREEFLEWIYATYPSMDWSIFDKNNDGYFDSVMIVNLGDTSRESEVQIISFAGGVCDSENHGEPLDYTDYLQFNTIVYGNLTYGKNVLIHEFGHNLGLIDYYDVSHQGIDAVGGFDMQSSNVGDWNPYSKYAAGWIEPIIVKDLEPGQSVEYTIRPSSSSDDAILIRPVGDKSSTPFSEYMLVDLFANVGTNIYDTAEWELQDALGVRIYHVDSRAEGIYYTYPGQYVRIIEGEYVDVEPVYIGTTHYGNEYKDNGRYQIELIQAGAINTFTTRDSRNDLEPSDLFMPGDVFTMEKYHEFFDEGKLDNGKELGYSIEVVSIEGKGENAKAVIRITRE